jgi:hypothetical protein
MERWGEMPKENVNCAAIDGLRTEVSWRADSHVQLATANTHSTLRLGEDGRGSDERDETIQGDPFFGWHVTLDRDGINRLIRALRRARDAAFGSDA